MAAPSRKFSLHLLRSGTALDATSLRVAKGTTLEELPNAEELPFPHLAFAVRNKESTPRWASQLTPYFPLNDLKNQTSSVVILFEAAERVWALTYGNGFHLVPPASVEPSFGLRVVANSIGATAIKSADARTPDVVSRTVRAQVSRGSRIGDLGVSVDRELVKHLAGQPMPGEDAETWARRLAGSDSLQINAAWELPELAEHAQFLIQQFHSDAYRAAFSFIDHFRPLRSGDPLIPVLDEQLAARIDRRAVDRTALAAPEVIDEDRLDHFKITFGRQSTELEDLALAELYLALGAWQADGLTALERVHIIAIDADGQPASTRRDLKRYVAAELEHEGDTYMLVAGQWFRVEHDYVNRINDRIDELIGSSSDHPLPTWPTGLSEREYNELAAEKPEWELLDFDRIFHGGAHQQVEFADLMSADGSALVHVKKMSSSATLSHLWAQGTVASRLYRSDQDFQAKVRDRFPAIQDDMADIRLVYAVANSRNGELGDELFFFSKVHLVQQLETLNLIGCPVDLVKIQMQA